MVFGIHYFSSTWGAHPSFVGCGCHYGSVESYSRQKPIQIGHLKQKAFLHRDAFCFVEKIFKKCIILT